MTHEPLISALLNHLWQSTLFAVGVGLLTQAFQRNAARIRYWIWFSASLKFLIPFSLLLSAGQHSAWANGHTATPSGFSSAIEQVTQPFSSARSSIAHQAAKQSADGLPTFILSVWVCGSIVVGMVWLIRWLRLRADVRGAAPIHLRAGISVLCSPVLREPGVFGILRPKLIFPEGIVERLTRAEMDTILAHELCHIQNRDNLTAALHMVVEAIFWFHPLVWWMGARLVEERERACDEEVLHRGSKAHIYAEGILKACEFYLASPLICVSGMSGSSLRKRIARIMTLNVTRRLGLGKKLSLIIGAMSSVVAPVVFGIFSAHPDGEQSISMNSAGPRFEAVSIEANQSGSMRELVRFLGDRCSATNITLKTLVSIGYGIQEPQVLGGPEWLNSEKYNIAAKAPTGPDTEQRMSQMVRNLLADRFKLRLHKEFTEVPVYELVVAKAGPRLRKAGSGIPPAARPRDVRIGPATLVNQFSRTKSDVSSLAGAVSRAVGRPVIDKTGLAGRFDYMLFWTPNENGGTTSNTPKGISISIALEEQLGLRLESAEEQVAGVVIDHVERPILETADLSPAHAKLVMLQTISRTGELTHGLPSNPTRLNAETHSDIFGRASSAHLTDFDDRLGLAVFAAAKQWTIKPAMQRGQLVEGTDVIVFGFRPRD